jgi:hypothetical protein
MAERKALTACAAVQCFYLVSEEAPLVAANGKLHYSTAGCIAKIYLLSVILCSLLQLMSFAGRCCCYRWACMRACIMINQGYTQLP